MQTEEVPPSATDSESEQRQNEFKRTPLPVAQLISVGLLQLSEPLTGLCIYPFINQFIRETGITGGDEKKTGYYGGIVESLFFLTEAITVVPWGYASDRYGRRPILLIAPLGLTAAMLIFGTSTTFWPLVVARCMQGVFNGNIGVTRSVMAESTDSTNRADAFSLSPMIWITGATTAALIGGVLSNPAQRWPNGIGRLKYLKSHPYFLPCAAAGFLSFIAFVIPYFLLKETLPSLVEKDKRKRPLHATDATEESPLLGTDSALEPLAKPKFRDAFTRPIILSVVANGSLAFCDMSNAALVPLMWSTSIPLGGLGLDPFHIGSAMAAAGLINAAIQLKFMAPVMRRFGIHRVFRVAVRNYLISFSMFPLMKFFAQRAGHVNWLVAVCMAVQLLCQTGAAFAYGSIQVIVVESVAPGGPMGTANGLAQMAGSGARSFAPTFASSLFAFSLQHSNLANGNLVYIICLSIALLGVWGTTFLPKDSPSTSKSATTSSS